MSKKTIVVADNSYTIRRIVELSLSEEDIELISLENGLNLKEKLLEVKPTIILIDIKLPGFSGYEVCKFVAETESLKSTKVFLMKGSFEPADEGLLKDLKYIDIITKPFDSNALVSSIKKILEESPESEAVPVSSAPEVIPSSMPEDVPEIDGVSPGTDENISFSDIKDELDSEVIPREEVMPSEEITQGAQQEPDTLSPEKEEEDIDNPFMDDGSAEPAKEEEAPPVAEPAPPPETPEMAAEDSLQAPPPVEIEQPDSLEIVPEGPSDSEMDDLIGEPAPEESVQVEPSDELTMDTEIDSLEPSMEEQEKNEMEDMVSQMDQPETAPADDALEIIPEGEPMQEAPLEVTTEPEPQISIEPTMSEEELNAEMGGLDLVPPDPPAEERPPVVVEQYSAPEPKLDLEPQETLETAEPKEPEEYTPEEISPEPQAIQPEAIPIQSEHIINKVEDKLASSVKEMLWEILPPIAEKMIQEEIARIKAEVESTSTE